MRKLRCNKTERLFTIYVSPIQSPKKGGTALKNKTSIN